MVYISLLKIKRTMTEERVNWISFLTGVATGCVLALVAFILMIEFLR